MIRSKLLVGLGLYYLVLSALNLLGVSEVLGRDWLYQGQFVLELGFGVALAVGLFRQSRWTIPIFVWGALILIVLNWFWLRANPPEDMFWGTKWLIAVVLNLFPGALLFFRRNRLRSVNDGVMTGEANA